MSASKSDKEARLKAALRDNLRKRKAQERDQRVALAPTDGTADGSVEADNA